jgi:hypothetical protein
MAKLTADGTRFELGGSDASATAYADETAWTRILGITDFTLGGESRETITFRDLDSLSETLKTSTVLQFADSTLSLETDLADAASNGIEEVRAAFDSREERFLKVTFEDGTIMWTKIRVLDMGSLQGSVGGKVERQLTFRQVTIWTQEDAS